ncbi:amino acid ABC transporter permease, partial [Rhizobium ruizarguesonis]
VIYSLLCLVAWIVVHSFETRNAKFAPTTAPAKATMMASV